MGNKKNAVWIVEIFTNEEKHTLLKEYAFSTVVEIVYVLDVKPTTISNFYHNLIKPRGILHNVNILYQKKI